MGQFDLQRSKSPADSLAGGNAIARAERRPDVHDQAHPASTMIDDEDAVIVAEWARKADRARCRRTDLSSARGLESDATSLHAAFVDVRKPFRDCARRREIVGERRSLSRALAGGRTSRGRIVGRERGGHGGGSSVVRLRLLNGSNLLASRDRYVAGAQRLAAGLHREGERLLFQGGKLLPAVEKVLPAADELGACRGSGLLEPFAFTELGGKLGGPRADHGQGGVQQDPDLDQFVGAALVRNRQQRRPAAHHGKPGEQRGHWPLLDRELLAVRRDIGGCETELQVGGGDPRLRSFDILSRGGLLRAQPPDFVTRFCSRLLEPGRFLFGRGLFGPRLLKLAVNRDGAREHRRASGNEQWKRKEDGGDAHA